MSVEKIQLTNGVITVQFTREGALKGLIDHKTGRNYMAPITISRRPLFKLIFSEMDERGQVLPGEVVLNSNLARSIEWEREERKLKSVFRQVDGLDLDVECIVELRGSEPFSHWRIVVKNHTPMALRAVEYPVLHTVSQLGADASDDRILIPKHDGHLVGNPQLDSWEGDGIPRNDQRYFYPGEGRQTPGGLSAQLNAYYDSEGGLYIAAHDGAGHPKRLGPVHVRTETDHYIDFSPAHHMPERPGGEYASSYDTVIGFFQGDWQQAADVYKSWAIGQEWCSRPLATRDDVPEWVKRGAFFLSFRLRYQEGDEAFLERVPAFVEEWQSALGIPAVAMMSGWEKLGEWAGPDYFPPYGGDEAFRRMCEELKRRGIRPFPFGLSGLKLPLRKKIPASGAQPELAVDYSSRDVFERNYRRHAATDAAGNVILDSTVDSWDGLHAYACVASEQAKEQLYGATMKLISDYGIQISQADQLFNGASTECYRTDHEHPPGRGSWQVDKLKGIYRDIRRDGKAADPDFILSQEWQSELYLQEMDIYHTRNYDQPRGLMGVPLFAYLYHEYQPSYGGDWSSFLSDNTNGLYYFGANFVNGNLPAGSPLTLMATTRNRRPSEADARLLAMARNGCMLFQRFTDYLVLGRMLPVHSLQVSNMTISFVGINFGFAKRPHAVPAVLHRAWEAPDGRKAYALANVTDEPQRFPLTVMDYGIEDAVRLMLYRNGEPGIEIASHVKLPYLVELELQPLDHIILELMKDENLP